MVSKKDKLKFRKQNKKRKEYYKKYYSGERLTKHYDNMSRIDAMTIESGHKADRDRKNLKESKKKLIEKGDILEVDGITLYSMPYAIKKINNLKEATVRAYLREGVIPAPIYIRKKPNGLIKKYFSKRQVIMINRKWNKRTKFNNKEKISEYLHANWLEGELGFGGESND